MIPVGIYNKKLSKLEYVIDFERLNQLTSHPNDNPNSNNAYSGNPTGYCHSITRKVIKQYLDIYLDTANRVRTEELLEEAINSLHYNKILISKSDIRDNKINNILNNTETNTETTQ